MPLTISMSAAQLLKKQTFDAHTQWEKSFGLKLQLATKYDVYAMLKLFYALFHSNKKIISQHVSADGIAFVKNKQVSSIGRTPVEPDIVKMVLW
jgi:light-regulated signal transduction histidine kinase (bacteriophytochrome)